MYQNILQKWALVVEIILIRKENINIARHKLHIQQKEDVLIDILLMKKKFNLIE